MGLRSLAKGMFPETSGAVIHIGAAEVPAGEWIDPNLEQAEYRDFLEAARLRARGIVPEPEYIQDQLPCIDDAQDGKEEK